MAALSPSAVPVRPIGRSAATPSADSLLRPVGASASDRERIGGGVVQVRAYDRTSGGKLVRVSAHTRPDPPGGDGPDPAAPSPPDAAPTRLGVELAARRESCESQRLSDEAMCRSPVVVPTARRSCWASVAERYAQCLRGGYVPPLATGR